MSKPLLHLWSISIEMHFYAFAPILLILFFSKKKKLFLSILPIILILIFLTGYILQDGFYKVDSLKKFLGSGLNNFFYLTPFRIYGFLFGIFAFIISKYNFYKKRYATASVILSGFLIAFVIFLDLLKEIFTHYLMDYWSLFQSL